MKNIRKEADKTRSRKADTRTQKHPVIMNKKEQVRLFVASIVASAKAAIKIAKEQYFKEDIVMVVNLRNIIDFPCFELEFNVQFLKDLAPIHDDDELLVYLLEQHIGSGLNIYGYDDNGELVDIGKAVVTDRCKSNE